ncbi:hypothetical protein OG912_25280 [Streptomyces sp. NBC_00464]|uniref:hypothetical protein n=1 Tax=Streptomyces sp. NBC_00464 TaxID=2975751 RepID=UPI002E171FA8
MDDAKTTMAPPVYLMMDAPKPPKPHEGCDVCGALVDERTEAARAGDWSRVVDLNVEIGRHRAGLHK